MVLRWSQRSFAWRLFAVTTGKLTPSLPCRASGSASFRSRRSKALSIHSVWCNGVATVKTAAHDDFAVGEYHCAVRGITI